MQNTEIKPLNLVLTHHWFDEIKAGRKTTEYRLQTDYWFFRLRKLESGHPIIFRRGYSNVSLKAKEKGLRILGFYALPPDVRAFMDEEKNHGKTFYAIDFDLTEGTK